MQFANLSPETKDQLLQVYQSSKSISVLTPYADKLGINPSTLMRRLQDLNKEQQVMQQAKNIGLRFPQQSLRKWNDYMVLEEENALIISDIESPDADLVWLETVVLVAIKNNIKRLIILGDTSAGDQEGLATHLAVWRESDEVDFTSSIGMLQKMLGIFLVWFDSISVCAGNHDERISKVTGGQVHLGMLIQNPKVEYSRYRKLYIKNHRGIVACYHQAGFSQDGISLARKMYDVEPGFNKQKPYAVIITHIHHWACGKSKDNLAEVYSLGCSRDPELTQYINVTPSSLAKWSQSMIVMRDGYIRNLERDSTNWKVELGEYANKSSICGEI